MTDGPFIAPCRFCAEPVEVHDLAVSMWARCNRDLRARGESPLGPNEIIVCESEACQARQRLDMDEREEREQKELKSILDDVTAGRYVHVPADLIQHRPGHYATIQEWIAYRKRKKE